MNKVIKNMNKVIKKPNTISLKITVFLSGLVVMIFELAGSRVLGPYFGTSIFVWSSLIGIILGSLSLGYWLGGKISDKKPKVEILSLILLIAGIFIAFVTFIKDPLLIKLVKMNMDIKSLSVIASLCLFALPSILLGMVSPYAVKLKMEKLDDSGKTVGNLYALSTLGSIVGTFIAGFVLIPLIGTSKILFSLSIILFFCATILYLKKMLPLTLILSLLIVLFGFNKKLKGNIIADVDTRYSRVWIVYSKDNYTGKNIKLMRISNQSSSAVFLNDDELVFKYTKYFRLDKHFKPDLNKTLMIGGAAFSYPKDFIKKNVEAEMDVIEIDPGVTKLAGQYFGLRPNKRLNIFHEDARTYLNKTREKYDVIYGDAFKSIFSIPFHLTTIEVVEKMYHILNDNGIVILNLSSALKGEKSLFLSAEYNTYKEIFPQVFVFQVDKKRDDELLQNIILIARKSNEPICFESEDAELNKYLQTVRIDFKPDNLPILTDDHAPVEFYTNKAMSKES